MSEVVRQAERILSWHRAHGRPVATLLRPGSREGDIERFQKRLGWRVPREAAELFAWKDGVAWDESVALDDIYFFPWHFLVSSEEAVTEVGLRRSTGEFPEWFRWLPVFANASGDFKLMDCSRASRGSAPVLSFLHGHPEVIEEYSSLSKMLEVVAECLEQGAFYLDGGFLEIDDDKEAAIAREIDPRVEYWWRRSP